MKKGLIKIIAASTVATLSLSGCTTTGIKESDNQGITIETTESITNSTTAETTSTDEIEENTVDHLSAVKQTIEESDTEQLSLDEADTQSMVPEEGDEISFRGWVSNVGDNSDDGYYISFNSSDYDVDFDYFIHVYVTNEQKSFIEANKYDELEISFIYEKNEYGYDIYSATPVDIKVVTDDPADIANYDESIDPLKGLVADDILTAFRSEHTVKDPTSVKEEAVRLGHWVQKTIGKDGFTEENKEKGTDIGYSYEFCFGTDVSNNIENNLPYMYKVYYALKDYYNSNGTNSKDMYDALVEQSQLPRT